MTYKKPDPGNGWRLFEPDGISVAPSDLEYIDVCPTSETGHKWQKSCCAGESFEKIFPELFYRTREGVKPKPYTAKASITVPAGYLKAEKWRRLALRMRKAKTIREAREIYNKGVGSSSDNAASRGTRPA